MVGTVHTPARVRRKTNAKWLQQVLLVCLIGVIFIAILSLFTALFRHSNVHLNQEHRFFVKQQQQLINQPPYNVVDMYGSITMKKTQSATKSRNVDKVVTRQASENTDVPADVATPAAATTASKGCLDDECIQQTAATIARAFPIRRDKSTWCIPADIDNKQQQQQQQYKGILLTKVPKGASSTSAGVAIRIAARHSCTALEWKHRNATEFYKAYLPDQSFLFTTIRDPAARAISTIFFHHVISRFNVTAINSLIMHHLKWGVHPHSGAISAGQGGFQLRYLSLNSIAEGSAWTKKTPERVRNPDAVVNNVRNVIHTYDFLIVPERMDESLTAMALVMGVDVGDVLVTSSKVAGSRYRLLHPTHTTFECVPTIKSFFSRRVRTFLQSARWRAMNYGDYLLHEAASQSLDLTVEQVIGRVRFDAALARYKTLKRLEQKQCAPKVKFPCSDKGQPQLQLAQENCYLFYYDFGCGYQCIDKLIDEHDKNRKKKPAK